MGRYMVTTGVELNDGRFVFISFTSNGQHTLFVYNHLTGNVDWVKSVSDNHNLSVQQLPDGNILAISAYASGGYLRYISLVQLALSCGLKIMGQCLISVIIQTMGAFLFTVLMIQPW